MNLTTSVSFIPNLRAIAQMNAPSGIVGQGARRAAEVTVRRAQGSVNAFGRVDTGFMRDSIHADFRGSNQHECRFSISSRAYYARFQHEGTRYISPAPFLRNAINRLRPSDFA
jgi:HK97 gp10 family phage protein